MIGRILHGETKNSTNWEWYGRGSVLEEILKLEPKRFEVTVFGSETSSKL